MKNLALLIVFSLLLACAGRQSRSEKTKKETQTSSEISQSQKTKEDSTVSKKSTEQGQSSTKINASSWKYTAPVSSSPCNDVLLSPFKPFYLITAKGDSIDVSKMPLGSSFEAREESTDHQESYLNTIDEQSRKIKDLESQLSSKQKAKTIEVEKLKEIEKQTIQWYLVALALVLGMFIPSTLSWLWKLIKKQI